VFCNVGIVVTGGAMLVFCNVGTVLTGGAMLVFCNVGIVLTGVQCSLRLLSGGRIIRYKYLVNNTTDISNDVYYRMITTTCFGLLRPSSFG